MIFRPAKIDGAFLIDLEKHLDDRGFFARSWCSQEFREAGLNPALSQCSLSFNREKGTLRGMHWQAAPHEEAKVVRCIKGAIYDVIYDGRAHSPTRGMWEAFHLDASSRTALYIPEGVAHGFQTLEADTELLYQMSVPFHAASARTLRWDDPALSIPWPISNPILSEKDRRGS